jgi:hypothetical protein
MSSRNRRSRGEADPNALEGQAAANSLSMREAAHDIYEHPHPLHDWMNRFVNADPININAITPDPIQPRRTIPSIVRQHWNGDMKTLFDVWVSIIDQERGDQGFNIASLLEARAKLPPPSDENDKAKQVEAEPEISPSSGGPVEAALMKIIDLAASIQRDGLTNPITALRRGEKHFIIETGERRWMAFHLLFQQTRNPAWEILPTRIVSDFNVWRQASENNARNDLNAIGKARQFALLLMDILSEDGANFAEFEAFEHEQDFYAQVADSKEWRVPHGSSETLLNAMGVGSRGAISEFRSFLRLPGEIWTKADDFNWSRETLYRLSQLPPDEALAVAFTLNDYGQEIIEEASPEQIVLTQNNLTKRKPRSEKSDFSPVLETRIFVAGARKVGRAIQSGAHLKANKRKEALKQIDALRRWLDEAERMLNEAGKK